MKYELPIRDRRNILDGAIRICRQIGTATADRKIGDSQCNYEEHEKKHEADNEDYLPGHRIYAFFHNQIIGRKVERYKYFSAIRKRK
jgi:hypothetical protein